MRLLERAQRAGIRTNLELVSLEPTRMAEVAGPCLPHLDTIVINDLEAAALTGSPLEVSGADDPVPWPELERVARGLLGLGVARLAVVHFPAGCVAAAPDGRVWRQGSVRVPADVVRSATGAGDAFAAGVVHGLHEEWAGRGVPAARGRGGSLVPHQPDDVAGGRGGAAGVGHR